MFNSVALDVVIGLVFIYLLYSLLVTVTSELISTALGLRARTLKEAIDRMLNDDRSEKKSFKFKNALKLYRNPENHVTMFFIIILRSNTWEVRVYLKLHRILKQKAFSRTVMSMLFGKDNATRKTIDRHINKLAITFNNNKNAPVIENIDDETAEYIRELWIDAQGDVEKFKLQLEGWFNRTMEQTTEWYKRKIRVMTLILGFLLAWFFNADTFVIVKNLSNDQDARDKLVSMANAYIETKQYAIDTTMIRDAKAKAEITEQMDSLLAVRSRLETDISKANYILGYGGFPPEKVKVFTNEKTGVKTYLPPVDSPFSF